MLKILAGTIVASLGWGSAWYTLPPTKPEVRIVEVPAKTEEAVSEEPDKEKACTAEVKLAEDATIRVSGRT